MNGTETPPVEISLILALSGMRDSQDPYTETHLVGQGPLPFLASLITAYGSDASLGSIF